jgi:hypothetical protein
LQGCDAWSLTLSEDYKTEGVKEQGVEGNIWGKEEATGGNEEATGGWIKLHEEPHNLFSSPIIIRMIKSRRMT